VYPYINEDLAGYLRLKLKNSGDFQMKKILAIAVATAISAPAMADLTVGGSARYQVVDTDGVTDTAGRVTVSVAGSAASESGASAGYNLGLVYNQGAATTAETVVEDNFLSLGAGDVSVKMGEFEMTKAFSSGADTFEATNTAAAVSSYENSSIRGRNQDNIEVAYTGLEGVTLALGTRIQETDSPVQLAASTTIADVAVAAVYEDATTGDNGMTITAGTTVEGVALNASYGKAGDISSVNLNASYMGFGVAYQKNDEGADDETKLYGTYTLADVMGIAGASVIIGAGSAEVEGSQTAETETFGVRLNYAF
jgi:hypothetical protein